MKRNTIITNIQIALIVLALVWLIVTLVSTSDPRKFAAAVSGNFIIHIFTVLLQQFKK